MNRTSVKADDACTFSVSHSPLLAAIYRISDISMVDWSSFIRSSSNGQNQIAIDSVAGTGDGSEYDIKKVVVVFQE